MSWKEREWGRLIECGEGEKFEANKNYVKRLQKQTILIRNNILHISYVNKILTKIYVCCIFYYCVSKWMCFVDIRVSSLAHLCCNVYGFTCAFPVNNFCPLCTNWPLSNTTKWNGVTLLPINLKSMNIVVTETTDVLFKLSSKPPTNN